MLNVVCEEENKFTLKCKRFLPLSVAPFQRLLGVGIEPTPAQGPPYIFDFSNFVFEHDGSCNCYIIIFVLKKGAGGVGSALKFVKIDY